MELSYVFVRNSFTIRIVLPVILPRSFDRYSENSLLLDTNCEEWRMWHSPVPFANLRDSVEHINVPLQFVA